MPSTSACKLHLTESRDPVRALDVVTVLVPGSGSDDRDGATSSRSLSGRSSGTDPLTVVPWPGVEMISSTPLRAAIRSPMLVEPSPLADEGLPMPRPSSATAK